MNFGLRRAGDSITNHNVFSTQLALSPESRDLARAETVSALLAARYQVTNRDGLLWVSAPGWDRLFSLSDIPNFLSSSQWALFEDQMSIRIEGSTLHVRMNYYTEAQTALHLLITLLFLIEFLIDSKYSANPRFFATFLLAHSVPFVMKTLSFLRLRQVLHREAKPAAAVSH